MLTFNFSQPLIGKHTTSQSKYKVMNIEVK